MKHGMVYQNNSLKFLAFSFHISNAAKEELLGYDVGYLYNDIYTSLTGGFDEGVKNGGHLTLIMLYYYLKT
jgi:hypothetical protein